MPANRLKKKALDRDYWRREREKINKRRRQRYAEDPEVRRKHKELCRDQYYKRKSLKPYANRRLKCLPKRARLKLGTGTVVEVLVVPVSYMSYRLGVTIHTIHNWEKIGIIPEMGWRGRGTRYWPILFIEVCRLVLKDLVPEGVGPGIRLSHRGISEAITKQWNKRKKLYLTDPNFGDHYFHLEPNKEEEEDGQKKSRSVPSRPRGYQKKSRRPTR